MWQIICWFTGIWQRWGIQLTPSVCYTRSSKQMLCVGLEVDKKAMIRNRNNRIPHPALKTKRERDTHNQDGTNKNSTKEKSRGQLFRNQRVFEQRGKKESRAFDELLQVKWPKEVEPLLYFLIELIQNPNFLPDWNFRIKFSSKQQQYLFSICARFHFCWFIFCRDLQIDLTSCFVSYHWYTGTSSNFNTFWNLISMRTW